MPDLEYFEPFQLTGEALAGRRPQFEACDRVQQAMRGYLSEALLSEDEWDRFAALREHSSAHQRSWRLVVAGADTSCLCSFAVRRLAAILDYAELVPQLLVHTLRGPVRVRRRFKDRLSRKVHFFVAEYIEALPPTGEALDEWVGRHLAAFFRVSPQVLAVDFPRMADREGYTVTNVCGLAQTGR